MSTGIRVARALAVAVALVGIWYGAAWLVQRGGDPGAQAKLPYPHQLVQLFVREGNALAVASWLTFQQALIGFVLGTVVGVLFSVVMAQATWIEAGFVPLLLAAQMVPMVALVPIAQNIFRNDDATRIFISAFITFFSVTVAMGRGLKNVPPAAYELMASYHAGRLECLRRLQLPAAVPLLFTGLRVAAPLSLVGSVLVDLTGAQSGLGYLMIAALTIGSTGALLIWAAMLILLALGFLLSQAVSVAERVLASWQPSLRGEAA